MQMMLPLSLSGQIQFSRRYTDYVFSYFPRKQALTFHASYLLRRQYARNVKVYFLGKNKKKKSVSSADFLPSMLSAKAIPMQFLLCLLHMLSQQPHGVYTTSPQRRCNVMTLHDVASTLRRRCKNVMWSLG